MGNTIMTDDEFVARLEKYLGQDEETMAVPIFKNSDGSINREKTLALPIFSDFKL